jgi:hypothetical protein
MYCSNHDDTWGKAKPEPPKADTPKPDTPKADPPKQPDNLDKEVNRILNTPVHILFSGSAEDIRKEYKRLALIFHPDKCNHQKASEVFSKLALAYEKSRK